MEKIEFLWTDGSNKDFLLFYRKTEDYYSKIVGGAGNRAGFIPYNLSESISDVLIAYSAGTAVGCAGLKKYSDADQKQDEKVHNKSADLRFHRVHMEISEG